MYSVPSKYSKVVFLLWETVGKKKRAFLFSLELRSQVISKEILTILGFGSGRRGNLKH